MTYELKGSTDQFYLVVGKGLYFSTNNLNLV